MSLEVKIRTIGRSLDWFWLILLFFNSLWRMSRLILIWFELKWFDINNCSILTNKYYFRSFWIGWVEMCKTSQYSWPVKDKHSIFSLNPSLDGHWTIIIYFISLPPSRFFWKIKPSDSLYVQNYIILHFILLITYIYYCKNSGIETPQQQQQQ